MDIILIVLILWPGISSIDMIYMAIKTVWLESKFDEKLLEKGYKQTNKDFNLMKLIRDKLVDKTDRTLRTISMFVPVANLVLLKNIIGKTISHECDTVLKSLDNEITLKNLESKNYIYQKAFRDKYDKDEIKTKLYQRLKDESSNHGEEEKGQRSYIYNTASYSKNGQEELSIKTSDNLSSEEKLAWIRLEKQRMLEDLEDYKNRKEQKLERDR